MGWPCCLTQCKSARPSLYLSLVFSPIHSPTPQCQQPKQSPSVLTSPLQMQNSILHRSSPLLLCCFSANAARLRRFCRFGLLPSQVFLHQTACPSQWQRMLFIRVRAAVHTGVPFLSVSAFDFLQLFGCVCGMDGSEHEHNWKSFYRWRFFYASLLSLFLYFSLLALYWLFLCFWCLVLLLTLNTP